MSRFALILICLFLITGCTSPLMGPVSSQEFPNLVQDSISESDGEILLFGAGNWRPSISDYNQFIQPQYLMTSFGSIKDVEGILTITEKFIILLQWNETTKNFDIRARFPISEITSANINTYGMGRLAVIQWNTGNFDSFHFTNSGMIDQSKTELAVSLLQSKLNDKNAISKQENSVGIQNEFDENDYTEQYDKLKEYKKLYDDGLITKDEYDMKRKEVLDSI